jgi:hypothetical protein
MTRAEELERLVRDLSSDPKYVSGRRSYPRTVTAQDSDEVVRGLQEQVDEGTRARARVAEQRKLPIVCSRGCAGCCEEPIVVDQPESDLIARWLARPENAETRAGFLARYPGWRAAAGASLDEVVRLAGQEDATAYRAAHVAQWRKRVVCAFNQGGDCTIYPVRPITCRNGHAIETSERCVGDHPSGKPASRLVFSPLEDYLVKTTRLIRALHHAIGGKKNTPAALCDAVHAKLTS